jgi:hypothetical protein
MLHLQSGGSNLMLRLSCPEPYYDKVDAERLLSGVDHILLAADGGSRIGSSQCRLAGRSTIVTEAANVVMDTFSVSKDYRI